MAEKSFGSKMNAKFIIEPISCKRWLTETIVESKTLHCVFGLLLQANLKVAQNRKHLDPVTVHLFRTHSEIRSSFFEK